MNILSKPLLLLWFTMPVLSLFLSDFFVEAKGPVLSMEEVCNNGIDDDNNGLIDFQDPACSCNDEVLLHPVDIIFDPGFDSLQGCCTYNLDGTTIDCLTDWEIITPSIDYFNLECIDPDELENIQNYIELPIEGGFVRSYIATSATTMESFGTCFAQPLTSDYQYQLSFDVLLKETSASPFMVGIYGVLDCADLGPQTGPNLCSNAAYTELAVWDIGSVTTLDTWITQTVSFFADRAYAGFALHLSCGELSAPASQAFVFYDNFQIAESDDSVVLIESDGYLCSDDLVLYTAQDINPNFSLQWYQNGIAMVGETSASVNVTDAGEYFLLVSDENGNCKRSNVLDAENLAPPQVVVEGTICQGENISYSFFGTDYNSTGIYHHLDSEEGECDTLFTLALEVSPTIVGSTDFQLINFGETYFFDNMEISQAGTYFENYVTAEGCDSIHILELLVVGFPPEICDNNLDDDGDGLVDVFDDDCPCEDNIIPNVIDTSGDQCAGFFSFVVEDVTGAVYQWYRDGLPLPGTQSNNLPLDDWDTMEGVYHVRINFPDGSCQLLGPLDYQLPFDYYARDLNLCEGETYQFGSTTISSAGEYTEIFSNGTDCDSVVTALVTYLDNSDFSFSATICEGEVYIFNSETLSQSGIYRDTLQNTLGCDSILTLNLTVNENSSHTIFEAICEGEFYVFNNDLLLQSGIYQDTFQNSLGCDSILTLNLTVNQSTDDIITETICEGETYIFGDLNITTAGNYQQIFTANSTGCDSIVNLVIDFLPVWVGDTLSVEQVPGTTYDFHGMTISETGIYESTLTATNGCDSLVYLDIDFVEPCFQPFDLTIEWAEPSCEEAQNGWIIFLPDGGTGPYTYSIDGGDSFMSDNIFENLPAGTYDLVAMDDMGCESSTPFVLESMTSDLLVELPTDTSLVSGQSLTIAIESINFSPVSYLWNSTQEINCETCPNIQVRPFSSATYVLSVTDENGCSVSDNIFINVLEKPTLYLPNIFSPNGDGSNEVFRPFGSDAALNRVIEMKIFSRWGELVFEGKKLEAVTGWDGTFNGKIATTGAYIYLLRWTNPLGEEEVFSGDIVLIH